MRVVIAASGWRVWYNTYAPSSEILAMFCAEALPLCGSLLPGNKTVATGLSLRKKRLSQKGTRAQLFALLSPTFCSG